MRFTLRAVAGLILLPMLLAGCKHSGNGVASAPYTAASGPAAAEAGELKTFPVRGKIVSVDAAGNKSVPSGAAQIAIPRRRKTPATRLLNRSVISHPGIHP